MKRKITDVFWDFDGTLFDTYPALGRAMQLRLLADGHREEVADIVREMKITLTHARLFYAQKYGYDAPLRFEEYFPAAHMQDAPPFAGVREVLQATQQAGIRHHLYTHRDHSARDYLQKWDLWQYFTLYVDAEAAFPQKPDPAALQHMLRVLGVAPTQCLMVGDRDIDILAGQNAGMRGCFFSEEGSAYAGAEYRITAIAQLLPLLLATAAPCNQPSPRGGAPMETQ